MKIIIADDYEPTREQCTGIIRDTLGNYVIVEEVSDGRTLVDRVRENGYCLVLTDLNMPRLSGIGAIREIRSFNGTIPIYVISGAEIYKEGEATEICKEAIEAGATGCLEKDDPELHNKLEEILKERFRVAVYS